jgi:hypothetical protein
MRAAVLAAVAVAALCWLTAARWPGEIDAGNLGLALAGFSPVAHHPQPPGYLFHVVLGKVFAALVGDAHRGLVLQAALTAGIAVFALAALVRHCLPAVGSAGAALVALATGCAPVVLHMGGDALSGIDALALGALVTLLCVRSANGEGRAFAAGSLLLGVAGGFRPDVSVHLAVAWLVAARPWNWAQRAGGAMLATCGALAWLLPTVIACGGVAQFLDACGYVRPILAREAMLAGGDVERQAATLWRIGWGLLLGGGPALAVGLCLLPWRRTQAASPAIGGDARSGAAPGLTAPRASAMPTATRAVLHAAAWPPLLLLALTFCHKKAYVFPALPALGVLAASAWSARASLPTMRTVYAASAALGLAAWLLLPAASSRQADADGFGRQHEALPLLDRLSWQPLEYTLASRRAMDARHDALMAHVERARADGKRVVVVTHPPDPVDLRPLGLRQPDVDVVELDGAPGAWRRIRVGKGAAERARPAAADGTFAIDADVVIACVGWDPAWAKRLQQDGATLVHAAPTVVFAIARGPVRW